MAKQKLSAGGFRLPTPPPRRDLAADAVEKFASESVDSDAAQQARELAPSPARPPKARALKKARPSGATAATVGRTRSGTGDQPYVRADGVETRSTTVHFPVELHQRVRVQSISENRSMSDLVTDAVLRYLNEAER